LTTITKRSKRDRQEVAAIFEDVDIKPGMKRRRAKAAMDDFDHSVAEATRDLKLGTERKNLKRTSLQDIPISPCSSRNVIYSPYTADPITHEEDSSSSS